MAKYTITREGRTDPAIYRRSDDILTEMQKQLEVTETFYDSAKERLQYTKLLYHSAGSTSLVANIDDKFERKSSSDSQSVDNNDRNSNKEASGLTQCFSESKDVIVQSPVYTPRSYTVASGTNIFHSIHDENSCGSERHNDFLERAHVIESKDRIREDYRETFAAGDIISGPEIKNDISVGNLKDSHHSKLVEYPNDLQQKKNKDDREWTDKYPIIQAVDIYSSNSLNISKDGDTKIADLRLNLVQSSTILQTPIKHKKSRSEKQRRISSKIVTIDDSISATLKRRKKKRNAVKISNSRCTTDTTENKKDARKRKQRDRSVVLSSRPSTTRRQGIATNKKKSMREVVEIYHNCAVKSGSISVVSSKHSKVMDMPAGNLSKVNSSIKKCNQPFGRRTSFKNPKKLLHGDLNIDRRCAEQMKNCGKQLTENFDHVDERPNNSQTFAELRPEEILRELESNRTENQDVDESNNPHTYRHNYQPAENYYDSTAMRSYESPTVASRLKQVRRSYFSRFHFRNIPFVVGTSVTPSYNLGLNIQEALSLLKTRQSSLGGVSPILINKMTKSVRPLSTLLEAPRDFDRIQVDETSAFPQETLRGEEKLSTVKLRPFSMKTSRLSCIQDNEAFVEGQALSVNSKIEIMSARQKVQAPDPSIKFDKGYNSKLQPKLTESVFRHQRQRELDAGDSQPVKWQNVTNSKKGIREVLINFQDQYEAMLTKFEQIKEEFKKTNDKSLEKEIQTLDQELNAKEEEINAVASLYQEVMGLKQQMRMLLERKSLVCVATELPGSPTYPGISIRAKTADPIGTINLYRRTGSFNNHGPPTSTRLAGLLRQIKTFQKQFKSPT